MRLRTCHNLQIQLLMKQGQVEINPGAYVHNFESCLLIHRSVVESLNKVIKTFGKQKIAIMVDCKDFRKGIRQLEWEHRKMKMTIEDYIQKQRDITYLKLSKEVQEVRRKVLVHKLLCTLVVNALFVSSSIWRWRTSMARNRRRRPFSSRQYRTRQKYVFDFFCQSSILFKLLFNLICFYFFIFWSNMKRSTTRS